MQEKVARYLQFASLTIFPTILIVFMILFNVDLNKYKKLLMEDKIVEELTAVFLFLSGVLSLIFAIKCRRIRVLPCCFFAGFSVVCILGGLEEISWGQRILDVESPEFFMEHSDQQEMNIHNVIQKMGENREVFGFSLEVKTKHVAGVVLFFYGCFLPLLCLNKRLYGLVNKLGVVVPPLALVLVFFLASLLMIDKPTGREEELGEFFYSLCFILFMIFQMINLTSSQSEMAVEKEEAVSE